MQRRYPAQITVFLAGTLNILCFGLGLPARGDTLDLVQASPDIMSINIDIGYSAATGVFSAIGKADQLDLDGSAPSDQAILNDNNFTGPFATFKLDFEVDENGKLIDGVPGPDLSISGVLDIDNSGTKNGSETFETLLEAEVNGFGFPDSGGEIFEVTAAITGGVLANKFSPDGLGLILNAQNSGFNGLFDIDFANSMSAGVSDTFRTPVPEPSSLAVFGVVAAIGLGWSASRRLVRGKTARAKTEVAESVSQIGG